MSCGASFTVAAWRRAWGRWSSLMWGRKVQEVEVIKVEKLTAVWASCVVEPFASETCNVDQTCWMLLAVNPGSPGANFF
jgi:hypothetical protein